MKKCPKCDSISADTESSCGVCGGSLTGVTSEGLEQLVHNVPRLGITKVRPNGKLKAGGLAMIILAVAMVGGGTALFVLRSVLGLILLFGGLVLTLLIVGGPGVGWGGGRGGSVSGQRAMRRAEVEEKEKERKRLTGEED